MRTELNLNKQHNISILEALQIIQAQFEKRTLHKEDKMNFKGTAERIARMYEDIYWDKNRIVLELTESLNTTFPITSSAEDIYVVSSTHGMIIHGPVVLNSMCPHHFMPVRYHAYLGYIPSKNGEVLGTSKLDRIPDTLSHRFVLQEQLAKDIADVLYRPNEIKYLTSENTKFKFYSEGSICTLIGVHTCEACRGVKQDARTMVTERRGIFNKIEVEAMFLNQIQLLTSINPF